MSATAAVPICNCLPNNVSTPIATALVYTSVADKIPVNVPPDNGNLAATSTLFTEVNADTAAITVLLFAIDVAIVADTACNSASVANPVPLPIIELIEVILARLTPVRTDTAAMTVLLFAIDVAIVADTACSSASVANPEPFPITEFIDVILAKLTDVKTETAAITVLLLPIDVAKAADVAAKTVFVLPIEVARAPETVAILLLTEVIAATLVATPALFTDVSADTAATTEFTEVIAATLVAMSALFTEVKADTAAICAPVGTAVPATKTFVDA